MSTTRTIEIIQTKWLNNGQPFRRLILRQAAEGGSTAGKMSILDQDSLEYKAAQDIWVRQMKGKVLLSGHIGFGYVLLNALYNPAVVSVSISQRSVNPEDDKIISMALQHRKFRGFAAAGHDQRFDSSDVLGIYERIIMNKHKPKKRIGKFI